MLTVKLGTSSFLDVVNVTKNLSAGFFSIFFIMNTTFCIMDTIFCIMNTILCIMDTIFCITDSTCIDCMQYLWNPFASNCILHFVSCILHPESCILYPASYTLYILFTAWIYFIKTNWGFNFLETKQHLAAAIGRVPGYRYEQLDLDTLRLKVDIRYHTIVVVYINTIKTTFYFNFDFYQSFKQQCQRHTNF